MVYGPFDAASALAKTVINASDDGVARVFRQQLLQVTILDKGAPLMMVGVCLVVCLGSANNGYS